MKKLFMILCLALCAASCSERRQFVGECLNDSECPIGGRCNNTRPGVPGVCVCRSDEACGVGEICNSQGVCQKRAGCRSNAECEGLKFCDIASGNCIDKIVGQGLAGCGQDLHCLPGQICGPNATCIDGCRDTADCPLYRVCDKMGQTSSTAVGSCMAGSCGDKTFCDFGQNCTGGSCVDDNNPNHCSLDCNGNADCGDNGNNFCLINSQYDPGNPRANFQSFCGVQCQGEQDCPNGYNCGGVVLLTQDPCRNDGECGGQGRICALGEGDITGFCTCVDNADCAFDSFPPICVGTCGGLGISLCRDDNDCQALPCDLSRKQCQTPNGQACNVDADCGETPLCGPYAGPGGDVCLTSVNPMAPTPCTTNVECACAGGRCANTGRPCATGQDCQPPCQGGGCFLGNTCAPVEGLLCTDVR